MSGLFQHAESHAERLPRFIAGGADLGEVHDELERFTGRGADSAGIERNLQSSGRGGLTELLDSGRSSMKEDPQDPRLLLGSCPDSWGVWFANDPLQTPWQRFLDEISQVGYEWLELGPYGYRPTDPNQLSDEIQKRRLKVAGGA